MGKRKRNRNRPKSEICPYCGSKLIFRPAEYLFMDSVSPGSSKNYYVCSHYPDCDAYMACDNKFELKGRVAHGSLRHQRLIAHRYIDLITANRIMQKSAVYMVIATKLGVSLRNAHIRFSNDGNIEKIIAILREILDNNNIGYDRDKIERPLYTRKNLQED